MEKLVIISGRSGSGKSTVLNVLEDAGYYVVDNLPVNLLSSLVEQTLESNRPELGHIAVCIDARNIPEDLSRFADIINNFPGDLKPAIIYLDADDNTLVRRFSETRRKHPLSHKQLALKEAIEAEENLLLPIADEADLIINTSQMSIHQLRDLVKARILPGNSQNMSILFESFGFKHGIPIDADLVFDARCLPNPYWEEKLRALTGLDSAVQEFLGQQTPVGKMLDDIQQYLEHWIPSYEANSRSYLTVAIGCTGGQHRSVYMAETLRQRFAEQHDNLQIYHRELAKSSAPSH